MDEVKEIVVDLHQVSCKVGYRYLLRDISWRVKKGEHWVVFGMNGSGKTTLLSIIAGFKQATAGTVNVFGEPFHNDTILNVRKRIGWVSASFFDQHYSRESALHIVLSGKSGTLGLEDGLTLEDVQLAKALLNEFHLAEQCNHTFDMFSKGERQNILIARALIANPDILILDEPCTGLDVLHRSYLFHTIEALSKKKDLTIIYVTHYVEEIIPFFQNILLLSNGHIFAQGETTALLTDQVISKLLGYPVEIRKDIDGSYRLHVETQSKIADLLQ